jgi:hypothetical protein
MKTKLPNILDGETTEFKTWWASYQKLVADHYAATYTHVKCPIFRADVGQRYIKIVQGDSVTTFIDRTNGDVLKSASYKAPAKGARGNIFDASNGMSRMTTYGPEYLR